MMDKQNQNHDAIFARTISATLDKSIDDLDELSAQRLKVVRAQVIQQTKSPKRSGFAMRKPMALSIAASFAVLMLIPVAWHYQNAQPLLDQEPEIASQEIPPSAQELDDLDMLMALEDSDA